MKILLTGASGLLGRALRAGFARVCDWQIIPLAHSRIKNGEIACDLTDEAQVLPLLEREKPDLIVHAAAERRPDRSKADPAATLRLNVSATETLARWCGANNSYMLYYSTDYVFAGSNPPYRPDDIPSPLNEYGQSKLAGERAVQEFAKDYAILRVPILYGPCETLAESAVTSIVETLRNSTGPIKVDNWAIRYPTLTSDVAKVSVDIIAKGLRGILHWSGAEALTKFDMAGIMAPMIGVDSARILPDNNETPGAKRPRNSHLDCTLLENIGAGHRTAFRQAIAEILSVCK